MLLCHTAKDKGRLNPTIYLLNSWECFNMERKCSQNYHKRCLNSISAMLLDFENSELSFKPIFFYLSFHESAKQTLLINNVKANLSLTNCHFYHINAGQGTHFTIRMQSHQTPYNTSFLHLLCPPLHSFFTTLPNPPLAFILFFKHMSFCPS